ncbi:hypothetical protein DSECCO2_126160 [anaerobic digester metagenome]
MFKITVILSSLFLLVLFYVYNIISNFFLCIFFLKVMIPNSYNQYVNKIKNRVKFMGEKED